jgi:hypothetical protein
LCMDWSLLDTERAPLFWTVLFVLTWLADDVTGVVLLVQGHLLVGSLLLASGGAITALLGAWRRAS